MNRKDAVRLHMQAIYADCAQMLEIVLILIHIMVWENFILYKMQVPIHNIFLGYIYV